MDISNVDGDLPISTSVLVDMNGVSQSSTVSTLQDLAQLKQSEKIINVVTGNDLLSDFEIDYYFTAAFPTLFPYGTGKHIHNLRQQPLSLPQWIQLMLRHSSRFSFSRFHFANYLIGVFRHIKPL